MSLTRFIIKGEFVYSIDAKDSKDAIEQIRELSGSDLYDEIRNIEIKDFKTSKVERYYFSTGKEE